MASKTAQVDWTRGEQFVGVGTSGHGVVIDAESTTAPGPMEYVLIALCGCTATDVVSILNKKREPFTALRVSAEAERAKEPPTVYTSVKLKYAVSGVQNRKSMEDAVRLSMEKYCSVSQMVKKTAEITYVIEYA
jgi:putative redox protein